MHARTQRESERERERRKGGEERELRLNLRMHLCAMQGMAAFLHTYQIYTVYWNSYAVSKNYVKNLPDWMT